MTWEKVPRSKLREPPITAKDFFQVLKVGKVKSSVGGDELQKYEDWTE